MRSLLVLVTVPSLVLGCGGGDARLEMQIAAVTAPETSFELLQGVFVTIDEVRVHVDDEDAGEAAAAAALKGPPLKRVKAPPARPPVAGHGAPDGAGGWITVNDTPVRVDLLEALTAPASLGAAEVPPGRITQVRLILADDGVVVVGGNDQPLACPSCATSGLKLVPEGGPVAVEGGTLALIVDVDLAGSLSKKNAAGWRLDPVARVRLGE